MSLDFTTLDTLRIHHPAWRLLRSDHAPLVVSFLHRLLGFRAGTAENSVALLIARQNVLYPSLMSDTYVDDHPKLTHLAE